MLTRTPNHPHRHHCHREKTPPGVDFLVDIVVVVVVVVIGVGRHCCEDDRWEGREGLRDAPWDNKGW